MATSTSTERVKEGKESSPRANPSLLLDCMKTCSEHATDGPCVIISYKESDLLHDGEDDQRAVHITQPKIPNRGKPFVLVKWAGLDGAYYEEECEFFFNQFQHNGIFRELLRTCLANPVRGEAIMSLLEGYLVHKTVSFPFSPFAFFPVPLAFLKKTKKTRKAAKMFGALSTPTNTAI